MILSDKEIRLDIYVNSLVILRKISMVNIVVGVTQSPPVYPLLLTMCPLSTGKWLMWSINHQRDNIPGNVRRDNTSSEANIIKHHENIYNM